MIKLSKERRDKLLMAGIGGAGVIAVLYFFVISSQREQIDQYQAKIAGLADKYAKAEVMSKMGPAVNDLMGGLRKNLDSRQEDMVLRGDPYYSFFQMMERFRKTHAVEVIEIGQPIVGEAGLMPNFPYKAATFTVVLSAYYSDLGRFMADMENTFPYWRLIGLSIRPEGGSHNRPTGGNEQSNSSARGATAAGDGAEKLAVELKIVTLIRPTTL